MAVSFTRFISQGLNHPWPVQAGANVSVSTTVVTSPDSVYGPPLDNNNVYAASGTVLFTIKGVDNLHRLGSIHAMTGENSQVRNVLNGDPITGRSQSGLSQLERMVTLYDAISAVGVFNQGLQDLPNAGAGGLIPSTVQGAVTLTVSKGPFTPGTRLVYILPDPYVPTEGKVEQSRPDAVHLMIVPEHEGGYIVSLPKMIQTIETTTALNPTKSVLKKPSVASRRPMSVTTGQMLHIQMAMQLVDVLMYITGRATEVGDDKKRNDFVTELLQPMQMGKFGSITDNARLRNSVASMDKKAPLDCLVNAVSGWLRHLDQRTVGMALTGSKSSTPTDVYVNLSLGH